MDLIKERRLSHSRLSWSEMMALPAADLGAHALIPLTVFSRREDMFDRLARLIADLIKDHNKKNEKTVIIFPVGPIRHYPRLVEITNAERISWRNVVCFNMDEWMDWQCRMLPLDHPWSFHGYMRKNLFERIDAELRPPEANLNFPSPQNMHAYSQMLHDAGGADLCYGGFGYSGHIANNEPPASRWWHITLEEMRNSQTRILPLNDETLVAFAHRAAGGDTKAIPPMAVTIGMKDILASRKLVLVSDGGAWKQHTLRVLLLHEPTVSYPCTLAQEHDDCEVWVDTKTAEPPSNGLDTQP